MEAKELKLLVQLSEETADVVKAVSKCIRFGMEGMWVEKTNRAHLREEVIDMIVLSRIASEAGLFNNITEEEIFSAKLRKLDKIAIFDTMHENRTRNKRELNDGCTGKSFVEMFKQ